MKTYSLVFKCILLLISGLVLLFLAYLAPSTSIFEHKRILYELPTPVLPKPNAFDVYVRAGKRFAAADKEVKQHLLSKEKQYSPELANDAAFRALAGMASSGNPIDDARATREVAQRENTPLYTLAQKEALLVYYVKALDGLRSGFAHAYWTPPIRSFDTLVPHHAHFRGIARAMTLESQIYREKKQWAKAMEARLDILKLGLDVAIGGSHLSDAVSIAIMAIGAQNSEDTLSSLSESEARFALTRLETIAQKPFTFAQTFQETKWVTIASIQELEHKYKSEWRTVLFQRMEFKPSDSNPPTAEDMLAQIVEFHDKETIRFSKPYSAHLPLSPLPKDLIVAATGLVFSQFFFNHTLAQVSFVEMLKLRLALRAYYAKNKAYPFTLQELVGGGYLKALPIDSFAKDGQFRYKKQGKAFLLYSVGPDGEDNGGKPALNTDKESSVRTQYMTREDSKGDIVVGVNVK